MKGLLIKDFYLMKKTCKFFLIVILAIFAAAVFIPEKSAVFLYAVLLTGLLPQSLLSIEERDGSDKYYLNCPVSKKQLVAEKYILSAIFIAVILIAIAVLKLIKSADMAATAVLLSLAASVGLIIPSISMPLMFKFGYAKGRIVFMCFGGLLGICSAVLVNAEVLFVDDLSMAFNGFLPLILIACSVLIFTLSCLLSIKLYQKREF